MSATNAPIENTTANANSGCLRRLVLFHGSPEIINDVALAAGTWLTPSFDLAREYGHYVYRVELPEAHRSIAEGPNWEGHFVTRGHIPWQYVELIAGT